MNNQNDTLEPQGIKSTVNPSEWNRFKPSTDTAPIDPNLINFKRPVRWMSTVEKHGNINNTGFYVFGAFCILAIGYFATRSLW